MSEELKVIISSDVDKSLKALLSLSNAFEELTAVTKTLTAQFGSLSSAMPRFDAAAKKTAKSTNSLANGAGNAQGSLTAFSRIVQDAPFGFIAVGNNITQFVEQFGELSRQLGGTGKAFKAMALSVVGTGGVTLAFSVLTTALTSLVQKYGSLEKGILALTGAYGLQAQIQDELNKGLADTIGSMGAEIIKVSALSKVINDESESRKTRNNALKELKKEYPGYFDQVNIDKNLTQDLSVAQAKLTTVLKRHAKAKALLAQVEKNYTEILTIQNKNVLESATTWQKFSSLVINGGNVAAVASELAKEGAENQKKSIDDLTKSNEDLIKQYEALIRQDAIDDTFGDTKSLGKHIKTVADIIKELNKDLLGLDSAFAAAGGSLQDLSEDKISRITSALKELAGLGVLPGSDVFNALKSQIDALQSTLSRTPLTFKIPIRIEPLGEASNAGTVARVLKGTQDEFRKQLDPFTDQVNEIIRQGTISGITSLSEGIGEALVSGNFNAVVGGFVDAISGFMGQLGKLLIAQGVAIQAFQESLKTLTGIPAIVAGGALIAASAAFRALAKGGASSFATGGTVFGPTLAMIGDNPGREEHIVPSEVLDKMGGGGLDGEVVFRIQGTELVGVLRRGGSYQKRVNGR